MIEGGGCPALGAVALHASGGKAAMERGGGCRMAGGAVCLGRWLQQGVGEAHACALADLRALVVAVTGQAVRRQELRMKGCLRRGSCPRPGTTGGGSHADIRHGMAADAAIRRGATQRRMACDAIRRQLRMRRHQRAGADHQMRIEEGQCHDHGQVRHDDEQEPGPLHRQPQNRKTLTICAVASTANASVIGRCTAFHCLITSNVRLSQ